MRKRSKDTLLVFYIFVGIPVIIILIIFGILNWYSEKYDEDYWESEFYKLEDKLYDCETIYQGLNIGRNGRKTPKAHYDYQECKKFEQDAKKYYDKLYGDIDYDYEWEPEKY